ncbi:hypothetical protein IC582_029504 [Cucumis melo]
MLAITHISILLELIGLLIYLFEWYILKLNAHRLESQREKGLKYLNFLKEMGKVEFYTVTDMEVREARNLYFKLEGIFPSKEASYAFAYLHKLCPTLSDGCKVVVHCSGQSW